MTTSHPLRRLTLGTLLLFTIAGPARAQDPQPTLVLRGGRLFDAEQARSRPLGQLWIAGERILGEHTADSPIPDGATVIDNSGRTVLPGLFDLHVHISVPGGPMSAMVPIDPADNLRSQLFCGVTHVLDLHGDQSTIFELRERSLAEPDLARLYTVGAAFTRPQGHATQFGIPANTVDTTEDVERRMAELLPRQPDGIKAILEHGEWGGLPAFPTLDETLAEAVVENAHEAGLPLFCHVWNAQEAMLATQVGADALAHGVFLGKVEDELAQAMLQQETAYVPTLSVVLASVHALRGDAPYGHDLVRECIHPDVVQALSDDGLGASLAMSPMARLGSRQEPLYLNNLRTLHEAGVTVGMGTDAGNPLVLHGPATLFELGRYVAAGLSPGETLQAATWNSANILRVQDSFGSLVAGKVADLVIVPGDPCEDIGLMWSIEAVYKAGTKLDREQMQTRVASWARPADVLRPDEGTIDALVDDFSDGDMESNWGGRWVVSTDSIAGGNSSGELSVVVEEGNACLRIEGEIASGFAWGPWSGTAVQWDPSAKRLIDASGYTGLRLDLRGTPRSYTVTCQRAAVKDFNFWTQSFSTSGDWQTVDLPFESFAQIGFGQAVPWSAEDIKGLQIEARNGPSGGATGPFVLELRSVELYR